MIAGGASTVVIMPDPQLSDRFWAAWTDESQDKRFVTLAFLSREGSDVASRWVAKSPDGYSPSLSILSGWAYRDHPVVMLLYQIGAAFAHADLYGVGAGGLPTSLGSVEGALIETEVAAGHERLRVYGDALLRERPVCYVWGGGDGLRKGACEG